MPKLSPGINRMIGDCYRLMADGIYDPEDLYFFLQRQHAYTHYSRVREAIHLAKTEIFNRGQN